MLNGHAGKTKYCYSFFKRDNAWRLTIWIEPNQKKEVIYIWKLTLNNFTHHQFAVFEIFCVVVSLAPRQARSMKNNLLSPISAKGIFNLIHSEMSLMPTMDCSSSINRIMNIR